MELFLGIAIDKNSFLSKIYGITEKASAITCHFLKIYEEQDETGKETGRGCYPING